MDETFQKLPLISVVIPAWNASRYLRRAVESIVSTRYPRLEIVVVDDASADDTWKVCNELQQDFPLLVRIFQRSSHDKRGAGATRNMGIEKSAGEYIAFLDADDWVYPWRFESAVSELNRNPSVDAVYGDYDIVCAEGHERDLFVSSTANDLPSNEGVTFSEYVEHGLWQTDTILLRRSLLGKTGVFDATFPIGQDVHLWYRMVLAGVVKKSDEPRRIVAYFRHPGNRWMPGYRDFEMRCRVLISVGQWADSHCPRVKADEVYRLWRITWASAVISKIRYHDFWAAHQLLCEAVRSLKREEFRKTPLYRELQAVIIALCRHGTGYWVHKTWK